MFDIVRLSARHEITRAVRRRTFRLGLLLVSALLSAAFLLEAQRLGTEAHERDALQAHERDQWEKQPDRHPHRMAHYGLFAFRPPSPLGFFDAGVEPFTGNAVFLEPHRRNPPSFSAAAQASELVRFGRPTAAFVLQLLLPLLIFGMTFDSVAGERELGTHRLALAQGAPARALLFGKLLGYSALIAAWIAPVLLVALSLQLATGALPITGDVLLRATALGLTYGSYLAGCAAIGVLVSALHRRSHAALLTLLGVWILGWVIVPRAATELAAHLHPVPSRAELELAIARDGRGLASHGSGSAEATVLKQRLLAQYGVSRVEDLPVNVNGLLMQQGEDATTRLFESHYAALRQTQDAQNALVQRLGVLSPVLLLRAASMALAGSDAEAFSAFLAQSEAYRSYFIAQLNQLQASEVHYADDKTQRVHRERFAEIAPFAYARAPLRADGVLTRSVGGLLAWLVLLLGAAWLAARSEEERA